MKETRASIRGGTSRGLDWENMCQESGANSFLVFRDFSSTRLSNEDHTCCVLGMWRLGLLEGTSPRPPLHGLAWHGGAVSAAERSLARNE